MKIIDNTFIKQYYCLQETIQKWREPGTCLFFSWIEIKQSTWVSYNFKAAIDDSWLHRLIHYVKSVQIRSFFWSVFSCIRTEYGLNTDSPCSVECGKIRTRKNSVFWHFSRSDIFLMSWYYSEKVFSVEKLNLTWNKQTNLNKLYPLSLPKSVENFKPLI